MPAVEKSQSGRRPTRSTRQAPTTAKPMLKMARPARAQCIRNDTKAGGRARRGSRKERERTGVVGDLTESARDARNTKRWR